MPWPCSSSRRDGDALDAVAADLAAFETLLDESADLRRLIRSPVISREDQGQALAALGERAGFAELTTQVPRRGRASTAGCSRCPR